MRRLSFVWICLLLAAWPATADVLYYRSNSMGMLLERIPPYRRDESVWVMSVSRTGGSEIRSLMENGKESRRWESEKAGEQMVERELVGGVLSARRVYDAAGRLLQEDLYAGATLSQKILYTWVGGRLTRARMLDPTGAVVDTVSYLYATNGSLRAVRRSDASGTTEQSSVVAGSGGIFEERTGSGDALLITRYDGKGRLASREERRAGSTVSREDYVYSGNPAVLSASTEWRPGESAVIERRYDSAGRLIQETKTPASGTATVETWVRDADGYVVSRMRRGPDGLEAWKYALRADGSVSREEYSRRGSLEKVTIYGDAGTRTEELYTGGEMFLRVFYSGDQRVKEEVWSGGSLVRTRTYP